MRSSLIESAINEARNSNLTPKDYFAIDYTNKILLIKKLLLDNSPNKYSKWVEMIEVEVARVEALILRSLEDVRILEEVQADLKKNNVEWTVIPN